RAAAHFSHFSLYLLMFALPLSGWLMSSASPFNDEGAYPIQIKNMVFGLFEMPDPFQPGSEELSKFFGAVHFYTGLGLTLILGAHIAGALKHAIVERDGVMRRMIFG
ncbi:MAG: cytochrome b/b6 domain-containing protein, partial [Pseudomonadota bacterium]